MENLLFRWRTALGGINPHSTINLSSHAFLNRVLVHCNAALSACHVRKISREIGEINTAGELANAFQNQEKVRLSAEDIPPIFRKLSDLEVVV